MKLVTIITKSFLVVSALYPCTTAFVRFHLYDRTEGTNCLREASWSELQGSVSQSEPRRRCVDENGGESARGTMRRDFLLDTTAAALATFASGGSAWAALNDGIAEATAEPQTVVITGANSGVGFEACKRLARRGHRVVLACRTLSRAQAAAASLAEYGGILIPAECDLANLASIREFASQLPTLTSNSKLDCLCLNAGLCRNTAAATDIVRTVDGFELTIGTNHVGHFYLNRLLLPTLNRSGGRIVVTSSGVHDPESPGGAQGMRASLGDLRGLELQGRDFEMIDGGSFNADKAYKDSKLCNVLFTRELQRRLDASSETKGIVANCFSPGLIVGTGLFREQNPVFTKLFDFVATDLVKVGETPSWGGGALDYMTTVTSRGQYYNSDPGSSKYGDEAYGREFTIFPVSQEAQDGGKAKRLWELTETLLGLTA